jgi:ABC-2 type transport system permease protein
VIWAAVFALSYVGFHELKTRWNLPLTGDIIVMLFNLLFLSLTVLLLFSSGIILNASLFSSAETTFLLSTPAGDDHIFASKFLAAVSFSSWAFVLLGSPILIAYGLLVKDGAPWYFYALLPLFFLGFVLLPGSLGALLCLLVVNYVPRKRKQLLLAGLVVLAGVGWWVYQLVLEARSSFGTTDWVDKVLGAFSLVQHPLMPSQWISRGLQAAALGQLSNTVYYLALVWSNGLLLYVLTAWVAAHLYRRGYNRVATGGTLRRRHGGAWMDALLSGLLGFLSRQTRLLIVKDFRTFRRDPSQWAQVLIFVGLAVLYFLNVRGFYQQDIGRAFQNGISLLNLTATAFLMCAYTGRFIYPLLSLEGRKFWILGLLPLERERLLWGKFAFSAAGLLLIAEFLAIFSNVMLNMPWPMVVLHALTVAVLALGLSGLSVGLGAMLPNFQETDPSKIAVGFGGTLNLVAGLLFLAVVITLMAGFWHLYLASRETNELVLTAVPWTLWASTAAGMAVGALAVVWPLRAGVRALRRMEF